MIAKYAGVFFDLWSVFGFRGILCRAAESSSAGDGRGFTFDIRDMQFAICNLQVAMIFPNETERRHFVSERVIKFSPLPLGEAPRGYPGVRAVGFEHCNNKHFSKSALTLNLSQRERGRFVLQFWGTLSGIAALPIQGVREFGFKMVEIRAFVA
jgi:hypothetical protein